VLWWLVLAVLGAANVTPPFVIAEAISTAPSDAGL
jgi:hypothetical protein